MLAQQFDAYGDVVPSSRNDGRRPARAAGASRRARVGVALFWIAIVLIVLARVVWFSTAQPSGFADVERAHKIGVR